MSDIFTKIACVPPEFLVLLLMRKILSIGAIKSAELLRLFSVRRCKQVSFEAIETISDAEERAKQMKQDALAAAKAAEAEAAAEGKTSLRAAEDKAAAELAELRKKSDEKAKAEAERLYSETENKKAAMTARANARMDKAASLIVERVVNG